MQPLLPLLAQDAGRLTADAMPDFARLAPGLVLCGMVLLVLLVDLIRGRGPSTIFPKLSLVGIAAALAVVLFFPAKDGATGYASFGALAPDALAHVFKVVFLVTGFLAVLFAMRSREAWANEAEFHVILFGALAGMSYLASATELVGFYLAFETVSYTGFLMAGYKTDDLKSAEAGGKFVVFGAVASAVMLFGLSLVYGFTGTTQFSEIAERIAAQDAQPALIVAAVFVFAGFAFKAAAFPMQWWCPDVYEGAPAPVAGFLAVASKAAVFAVIVRILALQPGAITDVAPSLAGLFAENASVVQTILILAAAATMTWGNFAALRQSNLQRMLAYSSIAHAGYLLMTAAVIVPGSPTGRDALAAILFYFLVYLVMNLGAFWIVTILRRDAGTAEISGLRGAGRRHPFLAVGFALILFSLTGLPPTAGFIGKLQLFAPVVREGYYVLAAVGLVNGAVSLYYYAKPLREMFLVETTDADATRVAPSRGDLALLGLLSAPLLVFGLVGWGHVTQIAIDAVKRVP